MHLKLSNTMLIMISPVLSAQLTTAPTGRPFEILNRPPEVPPRANENKIKNINKQK